ncbi:MAG: lytic transglycosylase domain-containing protein [Rhizomicrobium sp.]
MTTAAFFALPFHNAYHLPPLRGVQFDIRVPTVSIALDEPNVPSAFAREMAMSPKELLDRWKPFVLEASRRFHLPKSWIRAVISRESGGRTMEGENRPIKSDAGAIGVMQVMPETYDEMRTQYDLGADPADPHDNIIAGTAYLKWLYQKYGFPDMFAAYNDGPGNFDKYRAGARGLPDETKAYLASMKRNLGAPAGAKSRSRAA